MLIKFGSSLVLNVTSIVSINMTHETRTVVTEKGGWFKPDKTKIVNRNTVELVYKDGDGTRGLDHRTQRPRN